MGPCIHAEQWFVQGWPRAPRVHREVTLEREKSGSVALCSLLPLAFSRQISLVFYSARIFSWFHVEYNVSSGFLLLSFKWENLCFGESKHHSFLSHSSAWANISFLRSSNYNTFHFPCSEPWSVHLKAFKNSLSLQKEVKSVSGAGMRAGLRITGVSPTWRPTEKAR